LFGGKTALQWASEGGHAETVRVLVELGVSLEAVDKVHIHAHALAY
jgi:ankyrin repeat protein